MRKLPTGTITLLFVDIEGSTTLLRELGAERYGAALAEYRRIVRDAVDRYEGTEVDTEGDGFFVVFSSGRRAIGCATDAQAGLVEAGLRARMGLHTGEPLVVDGGYAGIDVHWTARIAAAGHGGQVLLSQSTRELLDSPLEVRDLGWHRLKDLGEPVRLFQFGRGDFPPLRSLNSTNLPIQPTPLIGRDVELREATQLLRGNRLVTLTGPGGSGKTRLALQVAADAVEEFPDGVFWVPLQAVRDPDQVMPMIRQATGSEGDLIEYTSDRRMLFVVDNFEQVLSAAPKIGELLTQASGPRFLLTSREPLHIAAEHEYPVLPMREREAVALFTERARALKPDFSSDGAVVEICRRLDCLPLALELAAARVKALSTDELLKRLSKRLPLLTGGSRDAPERHRTLRATIAWSYELLTPEEQHAFTDLAVFVGGCTLEAAEEVCQTDLDTIGALVDKSLVRRDADRYSMLETVGEYALERLEHRDDLDDLRQRHAEYYLEQARAVERLISSPQAATLVGRLERDKENLRAALAWLSRVAPDKPLRLAIWGIAARLHGFGDLALERQDFDEAARLYRESLEIGHQLKDDLQTAYCLAGLAAVATQRGRPHLAGRLWGGVIGFERASGTQLHNTERLRYQRLVGDVDRRSEISAAFEEGTAMTLDEAVEYALTTVE